MEERTIYNLGGCHEIEIADTSEEIKCTADQTHEGDVQDTEADTVLIESPSQEEYADAETDRDVINTEESSPRMDASPVGDTAESEGTDVSDRPETTDEGSAERLVPLMERINAVDSGIRAVAESENRILTELKEIHRLYHNEYAGTLKALQRENEAYRKVESGRAFDGVLESLARIYVNYETLPDEVETVQNEEDSDKKLRYLRKNIRYLLLDIVDLLSEYGMEAVKSQPGDVRNYRFCQVRDRIESGDRRLDNTVAKSYGTGFRIENRAVIKEEVDVYFWHEDLNAASENIDPHQQEAEDTKPADTASVTEARDQRTTVTEMTQNEEVK